MGPHVVRELLWGWHEAGLADAAGGNWSVRTHRDARLEEALPPCVLCACRIHVYTHRRMAITAEDVWLEKVIPITEGFAVQEGTDTLW